MTKPNFDKWKFAGSLPQNLVMRQDYSSLLVGAIATGMDINSVDPFDNRFLMQQIVYITPDRVHGLLHYESPSQIFFMGYKCSRCEQVFLVPDSVSDEFTLVQSMRHHCMDSSDKTEHGTQVPKP